MWSSHTILMTYEIIKKIILKITTGKYLQSV
ncbi:hypothetical protein BDFB_013639 [Asbolus verrucosus]|uniref:Uncharacterized protein n=1 Tax=Asbolus verrucosus TaxID=1661398 RepID=A0A482VYE3_ASBVE|nr:hypothetical protein BDFB_013639 [Asbolus verrucosus]